MSYINQLQIVRCYVMSLTNINDTEAMLNEVKRAWVDEKAMIVLPTGYKKPLKEWDNIKNSDISIIKHVFYPDVIKPVSETWEVIVFGVFKLGIVLNKHGYHVQQLQYNRQKGD